jgi:hypothetical protein
VKKEKNNKEYKKKKPKKLNEKDIQKKNIQKRIPIEFYSTFKEYEDHLLYLKVENLSIFIICAVISYR